MFDNLKDWWFLKRFLMKTKRPLLKMYSRKMVKYNLKIVKMTYINLSMRYGLSVKGVFDYLPLKVKLDKEMENEYGLCRVAMEEVGFFKKRKEMRSTILLNRKDVTTTTFIHEFGHYIRFLIAQIAYYKNKNALSDFIKIVDLVRSRADVAKDKYDDYFARGRFSVDEEENFATSWERYLRDGIAPSKKLNRLFKNFKKAIFHDMHERSKRRDYEFFEDLEVKITPERRDFFDILLLGKRLQKKNMLITALEWYTYLLLAFILFKFLLKLFRIEL
jgi:hypothetical protein